MINEINRKLQTQAPYPIVPVTYANKELMPIHFAYDPGPDYDWSRFPAKTGQPSAQIEVSIDNSGEPASHNAKRKELVGVTLEERMSLLQRYLDLVKIELSEPSALTKRGQFVANSSGLKVSIHNVRVQQTSVNLSVQVRERPTASQETAYTGGGGSVKAVKTNVKSNLNKGIKKFIKIFKRNNEDAEAEFENYKDMHRKNGDHSNGNYDEVDNNVASVAHSEPEIVSGGSGEIKIMFYWSIIMHFWLVQKMHSGKDEISQWKFLFCDYANLIS